MVEGLYPLEAYKSFSAAGGHGALRVVIVRRAQQLGQLLFEWPDDYTLPLRPESNVKAALGSYLGRRNLAGPGVLLRTGGSWVDSDATAEALGLSDGACVSVLALRGEGGERLRELAWWAERLPPDHRGQGAAEGGSAEQHRAAGNALVGERRWQQAAEAYGRGLEETRDPTTRALLFSNRSLCHAKLRRPLEALQDANAAVLLRPRWGKAVGRQATALASLGRYTDAYYCFVRAGNMEPHPDFARGQEELRPKDEELQWLVAAYVAGRRVPRGSRKVSAEMLALCDFLAPLQNPALYQEAQACLEAWLAAGPGAARPRGFGEEDAFGSPTPWQGLLPQVPEGAADTSRHIDPAARLCSAFLCQPLTVVFAMELLGVAAKADLVVHVVGARDEVGTVESLGGDAKWDALRAFHPESSFDVFLVGPDLKSQETTVSARCGERVRIHRACQLYEDFLPRHPRPDVVVCQHPGLHSPEHLQQWWPAIQAMDKQGLPVALTMLDQAEWEKTMFVLYDFWRLRLDIAYTGRNPMGSINFAATADHCEVSSANQWLIAFRGRGK